jgi:hypothetical protein
MNVGWWERLKAYLGMEVSTEASIRRADEREADEYWDKVVEDAKAERNAAAAAAGSFCEAAETDVAKRQRASDDWYRTHGQYEQHGNSEPQAGKKAEDDDRGNYRGGRSDPKPPILGFARLRDRGSKRE